VYLEGWMWKGS